MSKGGGQKDKQLLKGGFWSEKYGICKLVCNQHGTELA